MQGRAWLLIAVSAISVGSSCKDEELLGIVPATPVKEAPPAKARDAALDAAVFPEITREGVLLFERGAAAKLPARWPIGDGETVLVAKAAKVGPKLHAQVDVARGQKATEVARCAVSDFADALFVKAYLDARDVVFVVCESPHSKVEPGRSVGVRLVWRDGDVAVAGRFENEGPPAYDTMDFGEQELSPDTD